MFQNTSASNSFPSTGHHTPGSPLKSNPPVPTDLGSPTLGRKFGQKNMGKRDFYQPSTSPTKLRALRKELPSPTKSIDPKLGPVRKTAGARNLPKIDKKSVNGGSKSGKKDKKKRGENEKNKLKAEKEMAEELAAEEIVEKTDLKPAPLPPVSAKKNSTDEELPPVEEVVNEE